MMLSLLTLLFIALKLTGHIDWSWWFVVMPTLIQVTIAVVTLSLLAFAGLKK